MSTGRYTIPRPTAANEMRNESAAWKKNALEVMFREAGAMGGLLRGGEAPDAVRGLRRHRGPSRRSHGWSQGDRPSRRALRHP
ncbi:hypothetical protein GCM10009550_26660 [Actinocorallia libanotica]|uniref:Uncharacterized protein n=1 Tax=Actinocorallia libanotica TaxID=46162 RepID=A0ABN1QZI5_9ACTN